MPSLPTSRSPFRSSTSVALALVVAAGCGGDDGDCGPGSASASGLVASGSGATLTYGQLTSGRNNDCPVAGTPDGVVSLTIFGRQADGSGGITLCVARPDQLSGGLALGPDAAGSPVRLIDLTGTGSGCTFAVDASHGASGTVRADGLCDAGSNAAGFALTVAGTVPIVRTCGATADAFAISLAGDVAVTSK